MNAHIKNLFALLGFILLTTPLAATAQTIFQYGDFTCSAGRNAITIIRYTGLNYGGVTIPESIGGLPVTVIGSQAFADKTGLTRVTIPTSVTEILDEAFANCTSLTSVGIPSSVTTIAAPGAFALCSSMVAITVDAANASYSSLDGVLFNKNQTTLIQYPGGKAGSYAIPGSVTRIGPQAFEGCSLTNVIIPASVTNIGAGAFSRTGLTSVSIPSAVTTIGGYAFLDCSGLTAINVDAASASYSSADGVLFSKAQTTLIEYPGGKAGSYAIPDSVTSIVYPAFEDCNGLTNVMVPGSVTNIESGTFFGCTNLQGVFFKGNPASLGLYVFYSDDNATVYYLPGTTGWGLTFGGRPAVLWNPLMQSSGVGPAGFGFNITGTADIPSVIEAATSLANPAWVPLQGLNLTNGAFYFNDPNWTNYPTRFYRIRSP